MLAFTASETYNSSIEMRSFLALFLCPIKKLIKKEPRLCVALVLFLYKLKPWDMFGAFLNLEKG